MTGNFIEFGPIKRPAPYEQATICDPSTLDGHEPPSREWLVEGLIPQGAVVLFTGDGGLGKSLIMQQLLTAVAVGNDWLGLPTASGPSFGLFCEDTNEELHRRQVDICTSALIPLRNLYRMRWLSGIGLDCTLMQFDPRTGKGLPTPAFEQILLAIKRQNPRVVVIDTLADTFGGNEIIRHQVKTYVNSCLGLICRETGATVILCGHPSRAGLKNGDGYSGSTGWNNSVRARLYLHKPDEDETDSDERIISSMKNNYGPTDADVTVRWDRGCFVPVHKFTGTIARIEERNIEKKFVELLGILTASGRDVSESKNSGNYAPKAMKRMPESAGVSKRHLELAMERLFACGTITNEPYGPPSKLRKRITLSHAQRSTV